MYSKSRLAIKWVRYYILAFNSRGHGIHSPFVYDFITSVLNDNRNYYAYEKIEKLKKMFLQDDRVIRYSDPGAGSVKGEQTSKKLSRIAGSAVSTEKFGRLLFRLANHYPSETIIELGSSLGISTAYLASANNASKVTTIEGSYPIGEIAKETFERLKLKNVQLMNGNFDEVLKKVVDSNSPAGLIFIDGNHRKKAVLEYFEIFLNKISPSSLIIIHDIHWSREMEEAWSIIQSHPKVKLSIDIFSAGLVFFRDEFQVKQKFLIRFN
jgi:predicted O-methyltransferase YrrM